MDAWVWILLLVVVAAVVVAVVMSRSRQRENRRVEAAELREPTADHHLELREKEAAAAASEAEARRVRAEADQRAAEAQRLEVEAQRAGMARDTAASTSEEHLRRADALDPDVPTDKEGHRLDEAGNRVENTAEKRPASGLGAPTAAGAGGLAAGAGAAAFASSRDADHDHGEHGHDHHGHRHDDDTAEPVGGRIGNMRGLDDDNPVPGEPERGRSDEAHAEHGQPVERIGNMRGLDDDAVPGEPAVHATTAHGSADDAETRTESADGDHTVDDDDETVREKGPLARAREKADEVLGRRDADGERRQPE
jgi:hypothetical protein